MGRSFSPSVLAALRELPIEKALARIAIHIKADATYRPMKEPTSRRWQVRTTCGEFEILATGIKWYDTRAKKGGGGAIDLAMHVLRASFVQAGKRLSAKETDRGPGHP